MALTFYLCKGALLAHTDRDTRSLSLKVREDASELKESSVLMQNHPYIVGQAPLSLPAVAYVETHGVVELQFLPNTNAFYFWFKISQVTKNNSLK